MDAAHRVSGRLGPYGLAGQGVSLPWGVAAMRCAALSLAEAGSSATFGGDPRELRSYPRDPRAAQGWRKVGAGRLAATRRSR